MKRTLLVASAAALPLMTAACGGAEEPTVPTLSGPDSSIVVTVDCGEDGVANVRTQYGTGEAREELIGRNTLTGSVGGSETYSGNFGTAEGQDDATLSVTTSPTRGTCTTILADYDGGAVLAEKETAGEVTLEAVISYGE